MGQLLNDILASPPPSRRALTTTTYASHSPHITTSPQIDTALRVFSAFSPRERKLFFELMLASMSLPAKQALVQVLRNSVGGGVHELVGGGGVWTEEEVLSGFGGGERRESGDARTVVSIPVSVSSSASTPSSNSTTTATTTLGTNHRTFWSSMLRDRYAAVTQYLQERHPSTSQSEASPRAIILRNVFGPGSHTHGNAASFSINSNNNGNDGGGEQDGRDTEFDDDEDDDDEEDDEGPGNTFMAARREISSRSRVNDPTQTRHGGGTNDPFWDLRQIPFMRGSAASRVRRQGEGLRERERDQIRMFVDSSDEDDMID